MHLHMNLILLASQLAELALIVHIKFLLFCLRLMSCVLKEEVIGKGRTIRKLAKQLTSLLAFVDVLHVDGHIEVQREIVGSWKQRQQVFGGGTQQREGQRHYS